MLKRLSNTLHSVLPPSLKNGVKNVLLHLSPELFFQYRVWRVGRAEKEMELLPQLCRKDKISIDVGAYQGAYTYLLAKYSKQCFAFEPLPPLAAKLREEFRFMSQRIHFDGVALSDKTGTAEIKMPYNYAG